MADLDELSEKLAQRIHGLPQRKLGRNAPCWCGSGKRYKACHEEGDRFLRSLPKMSEILIEIVTPLMPPDCTREQTYAAVTLAALAWNLTRFEGSEREEMLEDARALIKADGMRMLPVLMARAECWPDDKRIVKTFDLVEKPDDSFDLNVTSIVIPDWDAVPSPGARPGAQKAG